MREKICGKTAPIARKCDYGHKTLAFCAFVHLCTPRSIDAARGVGFSQGFPEFKWILVLALLDAVCHALPAKGYFKRISPLTALSASREARCANSARIGKGL